MRTISRNSVQYQGGRFVHNGNVVVDDDLTIEVNNLLVDGDLIVAGDLTAKNLYVTGKIEVGGDFVAADVACDHLEIGGNAEIDNIVSQNSTVFIAGDFNVAGEARTATGGKLEVESL